MNKLMNGVVGHLIDPITGRRYLPKDHIWMGNINNVEEFVPIAELSFNCRDLRARVYLLNQIIKYVLNSRLIIPTKNKYIPNAQAIDEIIDNAILKHRNGILKRAIPGEDYVDYQKITDDYICITRPDISGQNNKYIDVSNLRIVDIENFIEDYEKFKIEFKAEIKAQIELALQPIVNVINNVNMVITNLPDIINKTIHEHITQEITQNITEIIRESTDIKETIEQIIHDITNNNYDFNFQEFLNELTIKIELINRFIEALQQNFIDLNIELNLSNDVIQYLIDCVNTLNERVTNITNNYGGNIEINPNINPDINIGDLELQLTELFTAFANFQAYVNMMLFSIFPLITNGTGDCIAWDLAHDRLQINATDPITEQNYTFSGELSPSRIYHNLKAWSEHQFFTFELGINPRLIIRSDFSNLNDKQRLSDIRSIGLSILSVSLSGWSFSLAPKTHSNLLLVKGEHLLISPVFHNEEQDPIIDISPYEIESNKPILIPTPTENANIKQVVNIEYLKTTCQALYERMQNNIQTSADRLSEEVELLKNTVNLTQDNVITIQDSISTINAQLSDCSTSLTTAETQITTNANNINFLNTRVTNLEQSSGSSSSSSSSQALPSSALVPPSVLRVGSFNLSVSGIGSILFDAIACHPLTGQWVVCSSNLPGAIAYSDDDGTTWRLHSLQLSQVTFQCQGSMNVCPYSNGWLFSSRSPADFSSLSPSIINSGLVSPYFLDCCNVLDIKQLSHNTLSGVSLPSAVTGNINNLSYDALNDIIYVVSATKVFKCYGISQSTDALNNWASLDIPNASDDTDVYSALNPWSNYLYLIKKRATIAYIFYNGSQSQSTTLNSSVQSSLTASPISGVVPDAQNGFTLQQSGTVSVAEHLWTPGTSIYHNNLSFAGSNGIIFTHPFSNSLLFLSSAKLLRYSLLQKSLYSLNTFNWNLLPSGTSLLPGGYRRAFDFSPITGKTIILTSSDHFIYC